MVVGPAEEDPRRQGYTVVSKTEFGSLDDMRYYDNACKAHKTLKAVVASSLNVEGPPLSVYFTPQAISVL
jgi:hypothetical protein